MGQRTNVDAINGLCPQCGFATAYHYDRLTIDDEERKLARRVEVANEIWGA